jgi:hypothetical protein
LSRKSYAWRFIAVFGIITMMFGALAGTASASPNPGFVPRVYDGRTSPPAFVGNVQYQGIHECYLAAIGNQATLPGMPGTHSDSATFQNLSDTFDATLFVRAGASGNWTIAFLAAGASKTFTAAQLGVPAGSRLPVQASLWWWLDGNTTIPADGLGCVAKQAFTGADLPYTSANDWAVSGYNGVTGAELGRFDQLYLPIAQTNSGPGGAWNSIVRVANFGGDQNASVTVRFFPADDAQGSLNTGRVVQGLLSPGSVWSIDLSGGTTVGNTTGLGLPPGWIGSVHIITDTAVAAIIDRYKTDAGGFPMWLTNTASNAAAENKWQKANFPAVGVGSTAAYALFAPDVRYKYNGWNTGINVANTVNTSNHVWIQYFGTNGNAVQTLSRRMGAHGMTYFYDPASEIVDGGYIGGALILSEYPVAAVVDGVKYWDVGNVDQHGHANAYGHGFSYSATANAYEDLYAVLVMKGNPDTGMGATSGINMLNPNAAGTTANVTWLDPSGFVGSNFQGSTIWIPGSSIGFVYTMWHQNLPWGYYGSAIVNSDLPVVATTANVDYAVSGDGTAIWNLYNPCGLFRQPGDCLSGPFGTDFARLDVNVQINGSATPNVPVVVICDNGYTDFGITNGNGYVGFEVLEPFPTSCLLFALQPIFQTPGVDYSGLPFAYGSIGTFNEPGDHLTVNVIINT